MSSAGLLTILPGSGVAVGASVPEPCLSSAASGYGREKAELAERLNPLPCPPASALGGQQCSSQLPVPASPGGLFFVSSG